jgi:hypothetical protein
MKATVAPTPAKAAHPKNRKIYSAPCNRRIQGSLVVADLIAFGCNSMRPLLRRKLHRFRV